MIGFAEAAFAVGLSSVCGVLIGIMGVGGVIVVPGLIMWPAIGAKTAIACSMAAYLTAGIVGTYVFYKRGLVVMPATAYVCLGAAPGAFAGALIMRYTSELVLKVVVLVFLTVSTIYSIVRAWQERKAAKNAKGGVGVGGGKGGGASQGAAAAQAGQAQGSQTSLTRARQDRLAVELTSVEAGRAGTATNGASDPKSGAPGAPDSASLSTAVSRGSSGVGSDSADAALTGQTRKATNLSDAGSGAATGSQVVEVASARCSKAWCCQRAGWLLLGGLDGLGSAITGTSGPVLLLPMIFIIGGWDVREAVGCSQAVQVPISLAATAGNYAFSKDAFDLVLLLCLALPLPAMVVIGAAVSKRISADRLKGLVLASLLITSVVMLVKLGCDEGLC